MQVVCLIAKYLSTPLFLILSSFVLYDELFQSEESLLEGRGGSTTAGPLSHSTSVTAQLARLEERQQRSESRERARTPGSHRGPADTESRSRIPLPVRILGDKETVTWQTTKTKVD